MTFDDTLQRAFETLTVRLRDQIARELQDTAGELAGSARTDREAAVGDAETRARTEAENNAEQARKDTERDAEARLLLEVAAAEARGRDLAEARVREESGKLQAQLQQRIDAAVAASREDTRSADLSASQRLVDAVHTLDRERSLTDILDTLTSCAGREVARVGLLLVRAGELHGWRFIGFGPAFDVASTIVIPAAESGIIAEAIRTGAAVSSDTSGPLAAPAFAALPGGLEGLAVPVAMSGDVIAVLYADQGTGDEAGERPSTRIWPDAIEIMACHAARCLEAATAITAMRVLTERPTAASRPVAPNMAIAPSPGSPAVSNVTSPVAPAAASPVAPVAASPVAPAAATSVAPAATSPVVPVAASPVTPTVASPAVADMASAVAVSQGDEEDAARRYARLLVSEIKLYHEADVVAGRRERDLSTRLAVEIARARVLYEQRVPPGFRNHGDHFHDELVRTLANGDASLLGQMT